MASDSKDMLYYCDHIDFLRLTEETWKNKWFPHQIPLLADVDHVKHLTKEDYKFYKFLFTFLGMAENLVNINIEELLEHVTNYHDIRHYYQEQIAMENIHAKVYVNILSLLFCQSGADLNTYAESIVDDESLAAKVLWLRRRIALAHTPAEKILVFLLIEGIFFVSSFYSIGLLRQRGLFNGVCLANDYISRDEVLHTRAAAILFNTTIPENEKPSREWVNKLFKEAVDVEFEFIKAKGAGVSLLNMSDIKTFLEFTADRILCSIDLPPLFRSSKPQNCPLVYTSCQKSVNFFERDNTDYTSLVINDL